MPSEVLVVAALVITVAVAFLDGMLFQAWRERRVHLSEDEQLLAHVVILED